MGKETGGGGRRGGEKEEGDGKVGGGGRGGLRPEGDEVEDGEVDEMHQLPRSSLAAASIPSARGSFFLSAQNNHHHHNDHHQPSVKEQTQRASSPLSNSRVSSRTAASFKQRTVGQKMPGGGTARPPIQFAVSSAPQLARPVALPARSSNHVLQTEGQDAGMHFQGGGRPAGSQPPAAPVAHAGSRPQVSVANHSVQVKGLAQHSHPRTTVHRPTSRSASPGVLLQSSEEIGHHGQPVSMGPGLASAIAHARNFPGIQHLQVAQAPSPQMTQGQALHQQQAASSTVATQQQVSAARPPISGSNSAINNDILLRDRSLDNGILVKVCDRKVRLSSEEDETSLYALCRRWVRNDVPRKDQPQLWEQPSLPRPLTSAEAEKIESVSTENGDSKENSKLHIQPDLSKPVDSMSEKELLQHHVEHFKNIRKRCREDRMQRVARFKPRLALLLPANAENGRRDSLSDPSHHP
ncbi:hypothetical protein MPTK1_2g20940 [Marchantia polymorpha subsp. ruderalis]|uniref:Uncharacterized protein n=2 Tax=Marchantia polymorpha TaxID=3197 RepID=A0A176VN83_MARPO|nr:hypothetical protein AXG93_3265s1010 [Marchantia polymorpha subsp. ruderalis]PTQ40449.1 hypothetical protein MARPO_0040s0118 [Marchantia polymorpha]BBN03126.1 hypothetical protein Mp_2g20940 [Marchantia polymorpha subsp. ruderalis]|eukprot:PTQ40449.1 hypothetical protein MARPO_0040s0118 [Marchantia polymorpha]